MGSSKFFFLLPLTIITGTTFLFIHSWFRRCRCRNSKELNASRRERRWSVPVSKFFAINYQMRRYWLDAIIWLYLGMSITQSQCTLHGISVSKKGQQWMGLHWFCVTSWLKRLVYLKDCVKKFFSPHCTFFLLFISLTGSLCNNDHHSLEARPKVINVKCLPSCVPKLATTFPRLAHLLSLPFILSSSFLY